MSDKDFHIFELPESMKLEMMSADQQRMYAVQKRINAPSKLITQMARIANDAARPPGASMTLPEQMGYQPEGQDSRRGHVRQLLEQQERDRAR